MLLNKERTLQKMEEFFHFLSPDLVFKQYRGYPDQKTFENYHVAAAYNINLSRDYLKAKILAIGMLEALAVSTGGDLPISEFLGEVRATGAPGSRMEDFLPAVSGEAPVDLTVLGLLKTGRALDATFDLRNSPLAAFIYQQIGDAGLKTLSPKKYFSGEMKSWEYLRLFPKRILSDVTTDCAQICISRKKEFKKTS